MPSEVEALLRAGYVTVIRLPLDGGEAGHAEEALRDVEDQLERLEETSVIFLRHLKTLVVEVDGERRLLERHVEDEADLACERAARQQTLVVHATTESSDGPETSRSERRFRVWSRQVGGDDDPEGARRIANVVAKLGDESWAGLRQVVVSAAVAEGDRPEEGAFVIFLPTETRSGTGAFLNAPFVASIDRRHIDFGAPYNKLLLEALLDLCLDVALALVDAPPEPWRGRAVVDLLASTSAAEGSDWRWLGKVSPRARARGQALAEQALILCDRGWATPPAARLMPRIPGSSPIGPAIWRQHMACDVVHQALDGRKEAVKALLCFCQGSAEPKLVTDLEWARTVEGMAKKVRDGEIRATWGAFLRSVVEVLPARMRTHEPLGKDDPLARAKFLPTEDGRLLSASDDVAICFPPARGKDGKGPGPIEGPPKVLRRWMAFIHPDALVDAGKERHRREVRRFLEDRFVKSWDLRGVLRNVIRAYVKELGPFPVDYGTENSRHIAEVFSWTMGLVKAHEHRGGDVEKVKGLLGELPVACHGGWRPMKEAVFGPGWDGHPGEDLWRVTGALLRDESTRKQAEARRAVALLSPDDPRWGDLSGQVQAFESLFQLGGVVDGLRLEGVEKYEIGGWEYQPGKVPENPPYWIPKESWDAWRKYVPKEGWPDLYRGPWPVQYHLLNIYSIRDIHCLYLMEKDVRASLGRLIRSSFYRWPKDWMKSGSLRIIANEEKKEFDSPLKFWLSTRAWLGDWDDPNRPSRRFGTGGFSRNISTSSRRATPTWTPCPRTSAGSCGATKRRGRPSSSWA